MMLTVKITDNAEAGTQPAQGTILLLISMLLPEIYMNCYSRHNEKDDGQSVEFQVNEDHWTTWIYESIS